MKIIYDLTKGAGGSVQPLRRAMGRKEWIFLPWLIPHLRRPFRVQISGMERRHPAYELVMREHEEQALARDPGQLQTQVKANCNRFYAPNDPGRDSRLNGRQWSAFRHRPGCPCRAPDDAGSDLSLPHFQ